MDLMNLARQTIAVFLNSPAKKVANFVGIKDKRVDELYVDLRNKVCEKKFVEVPAKQRVVFLPQCLRGANCKAPQDDEGYHCLKCGGCSIAKIMEFTEKNGTRVFILPGGSMIHRMMQKYSPKAVIGVACNRELVEGISAMEKVNIPSQGIFLLKDGCKNTEVDLEEVLEKIKWSTNLKKIPG